MLWLLPRSKPYGTTPIGWKLRRQSFDNTWYVFAEKWKILHLTSTKSKPSTVAVTG